MTAAAAIQAGLPVILPTDTVYGLCASPEVWEPSDRLYKLKRRDPRQPSALLAADVETLLSLIPELRGRSETIVRTLLPGGYTLILPNPARRYRWVTGENQDTIGVRVAGLPPESQEVLGEVGAVVATSANLPGGRDPRRVQDIPQSIREGAAAIVDVGELPGVASTVLDFTGDETRIVREGAEPADQALARVREALAE